MTSLRAWGLCLLLARASAAALRGSGDSLSHNTGYIIPKGQVMCMQGPRDYLEKVLEKLRASPMQTGWKPETTQVIAGECKERGYVHEHDEECFPRAKLYMDDDPLHTAESSSMDRKFIQEWTHAYNKNVLQVVLGMTKV